VCVCVCVCVCVLVLPYKLYDVTLQGLCEISYLAKTDQAERKTRTQSAHYID